MTKIANEIIIKAAKAAGLEVHGPHPEIFLKGRAAPFAALTSDADSCLIMDGGGVGVSYTQIGVVAGCVVLKRSGDQSPIYYSEPIPKHSSAQARREAVIIRAATKWDAML